MNAERGKTQVLSPPDLALNKYLRKTCRKNKDEGAWMLIGRLEVGRGLACRLLIGRRELGVAWSAG